MSRALKDNPEISQQTRKTVQALAKELGYKPNPIAVALKTHKSNTIGVVVPQIVNTFFATVVKKIEDVADKYGYNVLVASSNETFEKEKKNIARDSKRAGDERAWAQRKTLLGPDLPAGPKADWLICSIQLAQLFHSLWRKKTTGEPDT